jgi:hypothetical protein
VFRVALVARRLNRPHAIHICRTEHPQLETTPRGSTVACHRWRQLKQDPPVDDIPLERSTRT